MLSSFSTLVISKILNVSEFSESTRGLFKTQISGAHPQRFWFCRLSWSLRNFMYKFLGGAIPAGWGPLSLCYLNQFHWTKFPHEGSDFLVRMVKEDRLGLLLCCILPKLCHLSQHACGNMSSVTVSLMQVSFELFI